MNVTPIREQMPMTQKQLQSRLNDLAAFLYSHRMALNTCVCALRSRYEEAGARAESVASTLDDYLATQLDEEIDSLNALIGSLGNQGGSES